MTYQVLARKWRPQDFSSIVGQEPIVTALRNALKDGRIAQAYLFSGIRGVGKTTAARVLAKALNCEKGPSAGPCNDCQICKDITAGHDMDVIEVDAATYSKVEQVRELTESLRYGPARNPYKVVILDEVHRLSRQAFDALLKIVEEPPDHLIFIFATTEIDAVPATILSRCQEFQFRRVASAALTAHLGRIAEAESIETSEAALRWIARAGEGSVRDSVALLDQLATFGGGKIDETDAKRLLGGLDTEIFTSLLTSILRGDAASIRDITVEIEQNGWDPNHVYGQFLLFCRDALHLSLGGNLDAVDLPSDEAKKLSELVRDEKYENLLRLVQLLLASEPTVRRSEFGHLALELTWLRAAQLPKLTQVEALLSGRAQPTSGIEIASETVANAEPPSPKVARASTRSTTKNLPSQSSARTTLQAADPKSTVHLFNRLQQNRPLAALFSPDAFELNNGEVLIKAPPGDKLINKALQVTKDADFLQKQITELFGAGTSWRIVQDAKFTKKKRPSPTPSERVPKAAPGRKARPASSSSPAQNEEFRQAEKHPVVQTVLEIFNGTIQGTQLPEREDS